MRFALSLCYAQDDILRALLLRLFVAFNVISVGGRGIGLRFDLGRFLGGAEMSGAIVSSIFDVVVLEEWWDHRRSAGDLADAVEDDLGAAVVKFDGSVNFDGTAGEAADVADILQAGREDHYRERAGHLVFAEVEEMDALRTYFYFEDFSGDAFGFANVLARFVYGDAVGSG
jgi:hypothetical protein